MSSPAPRLWLEIGTWVESAGGLAVRLREWWAIRPLVLQPYTSGGEHYNNWLRHSLTEAARANLLVNDAGKPIAGAFLGFARLHADRLPALRPDMPTVNAEFVLGVPPQVRTCCSIRSRSSTFSGA